MKVFLLRAPVEVLANSQHQPPHASENPPNESNPRHQIVPGLQVFSVGASSIEEQKQLCTDPQNQ